MCGCLELVTEHGEPALVHARLHARSLRRQRVDLLDDLAAPRRCRWGCLTVSVRYRCHLAQLVAWPLDYSLSCVSLRSPLPSAFTMYTSRLRRKAIVRPSGDHANQRTFSAWRVSRRSPLPSAFTTKRSEFPTDRARPVRPELAVESPEGDPAAVRGPRGLARGGLGRHPPSVASVGVHDPKPEFGWVPGVSRAMGHDTLAIRCPSGDHAPASGMFLGSSLLPAAVGIHERAPVPDGLPVRRPAWIEQCAPGVSSVAAARSRRHSRRRGTSRTAVAHGRLGTHFFWTTTQSPAHQATRPDRDRPHGVRVRLRSPLPSAFMT